MILGEKIVQHSITSAGCNILKLTWCTPTHQGPFAIVPKVQQEMPWFKRSQCDKQNIPN